MASQDARLSKFEADFKQQQNKMTNKIDTVLKAITDQIAGALPSDTVKSPKLNVNSTSPVCLLKDPEALLLVGRGFLATVNVVIDYKKAKIAVGEGITSSDGVGARTPYYARKDFLGCHLPGVWEIARDAEINPFKDVLDKPPKNEDEAWHAKIRLIDPDGEEFTKTLQSVPTSRKLSKKEDPKEIIDLDHFYDT
ncbi:hypothetical protein Tco_0571088 [Tanacetum coccineum]